jgi:hypothetical protein
MAVVAEKAMSTKVRRPAEWRLLERSQPMMEASSTMMNTRSSTE